MGFKRYSDTENTIFKMYDKREKTGKHDKQNLQKSLMGPSGWQEKETIQKQTIKKLARVSEKAYTHARLKNTRCHCFLAAGTNKTVLVHCVLVYLVTEN